ncbi:hypothetical protein [Pseudomonas sp. PS01300]|uniref:hypothetical protein n=1 Tax=Pseudomonas sp. PS01300 TaxID=2991436 RepID=UPI00249A7CDE|nr:hypothetical protein [Pseudomonas sp. PS01300]
MIATLCMDVKRILNLISAVMPILLAMVMLITTYSIFNYNITIENLDTVARANSETVTGNRFVGALLYASVDIAVGYPILAVIGRLSKQPRAAAPGGGGGVDLGALNLPLDVGLFANINHL